jgi:hypothetical protein
MHRTFKFLWLLFLLFATPLMAQSIMERLITPGPLSNAHARLESRCSSCHTSFQKTAQNSRCITCHVPVGRDIAAGSGFHGKFAPARSGACKTCHSDHKGRNFGLIRLDRQTFNHTFTDYALTGGHLKASCAGCHGNGNRYRQASQSCAACHSRVNPHRGQLSRDCQTCHTVDGWKKIKPFNHAVTGFALSGAHRLAACMSCHAGQRWKGLATTCFACHARDDAHKGSRGTNCASCHNSGSWKSATFDHSTTGFPLIGAHASTSCAGCHGVGNTIKNPPQACISCHAKDDSHKGTNGTNCASCHNSHSWKQVSFDHDRMTQFPLSGAHRKILCQACHKQPAKLVKPPVTCFGCHAADDSHKGSNGQDCERCHTAVAWKSVNFDHAKMTRFALTGKHATTKCEVCHIHPAKEVKLPMECGSCHAKDDVHLGKLGPVCKNCHDTNDWKTKVRFEHSLTRFPLLGKHAAVKCLDCHADRTFVAKGLTCADCHVDDHHKGALGKPSACSRCHNSTDWKVWNFNHDTATKFALTGQHKGLICSACHARPGDPAKLPQQCIDCHRRNDIHRGGFGENCERCHVTTGFSEIIIGVRR